MVLLAHQREVTAQAEAIQDVLLPDAAMMPTAHAADVAGTTPTEP